MIGTRGPPPSVFSGIARLRCKCLEHGKFGRDNAIAAVPRHDAGGWIGIGEKFEGTEENEIRGLLKGLRGTATIPP